jgi:hypothetical protein
VAGSKRRFQQAVLDGEVLRIIYGPQDYKDILPGDAFGYGVEIFNDESSRLPLEASMWLVRKICTNGALGFDKAARITRSAGSQVPALKVLQAISNALDTVHELPGLLDGIKWANENLIGREWPQARDYLARRLDGDEARLALNMSEEDSWYQLLNSVTATAQTKPLALRRRYEREGARFIQWFLKRGRDRPHWRKMICEQCTGMPTSEVQAN